MRLVVLALLSKQPMHGYEMQQVLHEERMDLWANLLPNSIYHALRQLTKEGFVKIQATEKTGQRRRVIYEITPKGKLEFARLVKAALRSPFRKFPWQLYASFSFLDLLSEEEVQTTIQEHINDLKKEIASWKQGEEKKLPFSRDQEILKAIFANGIEHLEADLELLYRIRDYFGKK